MQETTTAGRTPAGAWKNLWRYFRDPAAWRRLVFYSEGPEYWLHFRSLVTEILARNVVDMSYVSSSPDDPGLALASSRLHPYYIGSGLARTLWFMAQDARVVAMTMPDIQTFHLKRSLLRPVRYVYLFHAPVSTHMMYREAAFDHYDEIFCVGPHHEVEIRKREALAGLPEKALFRHGYSRLDSLVAATAAENHALPHDPPWVLVAPSWTDNGIMAGPIDQLARILLDAGFRVTVRAHPRTRLVHPEQLHALQRAFGSHARFNLEDGSRESAALAGADVMISDWSGVAVEYAFVRGKPVLSIDTPRKINNPAYERLGIEPMEAAVRREMGEVLPPEALDEAPAAVRRLCGGGAEAIRQRQALRDKWIFNVGISDRVGADRLIALAAGTAE